MKKIMKSRKGFTLVEMIIVIAIIVILASVVFFAVSQYIQAADAAATDISTHNVTITSVYDYIAAKIGA
ncbi:MAG: prepilin-type N-terminal cleavage/methylation domain-containing protein [Oscillospiraceae bacterium]|nr:prepilin-type N-terminal cleavage/methylation domain-containing protein [Oscillospiraceae bacterium]